MADPKTVSKPRPTSGGRLFLFAVGLSLALIGSLFVWLMARSCLRAIDMRLWPRVPCQIVQSEIVERQHDEFSPVEFSHQVTFTYERQGQSRTSKRISLRGQKWSSKPQSAHESLLRYPVGSKQECLVDPADPEMAILEPDSLAPGYSIWFPALFVVGGTVIAWRALRSPSRRP